MLFRERNCRLSGLKKYSLKFVEMEDLEVWMKLVVSVRCKFLLLEIDKELDNYKK